MLVPDERKASAHGVHAAREREGEGFSIVLLSIPPIIKKPMCHLMVLQRCRVQVLAWPCAPRSMLGHLYLVFCINVNGFFQRFDDGFSSGMLI